MTFESPSFLVLVYGLPLALAYAIYSVSRSRTERRSVGTLPASVAANLTEPASLHPAVDMSRCLGCGACVKACPEGDVLGLVRGKAVLLIGSA